MFKTKKWLIGLMGILTAFGLFAATKCDVKAADYHVGSYIVCNTDTKLFVLPDCNEGVVTEIPEWTVVEVVENDKIYTKVNYNGQVGYLYQEFITIDEELIEAHKAEILARSEEVRLLAALIQCEAGGEPIEGQVAVGAVVMNRVKAPNYPNTIVEVIYQPGQFTPAGGERMNTLMATDNIKQSCREAAKAAFQGVDNVAGMTHFRRNDGRAGLVIGNHVFY